MLQEGNITWLLNKRQLFTRVLFASTLSLALLQVGASAQQSDSKKPGLDPVASSSPPSKSVGGSGLPKPESARTGTGGKGEASAKSVNDKGASDKTEDPPPEKSTLPFPIIGSDGLGAVPGVQPVNSHSFPSAIDIHGSSAGVLLHARKETRYDLLSPLSIWLEDGPLLVSVRHPSEMVLVATKFGDVCITTGGDAIVERTEEDLLRVINICNNNETVFLNMHDKLWTNSPWGHIAKTPLPKQKKKGKHGSSNTYDDIDSGAVTIAPGYELVIGGHALTMDDVKPEDSIGRRDFRTFENGRMVTTEISVDNLTQIHDLVKNLNTHGEKASAIFSDIMKTAGLMKAKQGDSGFEKRMPAPPKAAPPKRKPPTKVPPPPSKTPPPPASKTPPPPSKTPPPPSKTPPPPATNKSSTQGNSQPATPPTGSKPAGGMSAPAGTTAPSK